MTTVAHDDIELREVKDQQALTQQPQPVDIQVENPQPRTSLSVSQPKIQETPVDHSNEEEEEVEVTKFQKLKTRASNMLKSFYSNLRFFVHHKNKVDKRNYYCGYTCHGWLTMFVYYLMFYAFLTGFFVGLYFLAYYIMYELFFNVLTF
jgi:hypothetical protein